MSLSIPQFQNKLESWFQNNKRTLPWRIDRSPYRVWISEIMLQQTRVSAVVPFYERWMHRLPDITAVAGCSEELLLKLWQGLGYYSRCKNIHKCAKLLCNNLSQNQFEPHNHNSTATIKSSASLPASYEDLLKLPGIGPYTAAAIASFGFGLPHAVVDGNVERVYSRYFGKKEPVAELRKQAFFNKIADKMLDKKNPSLFNEAIMELGALICRPAAWDCPACPIQKGCIALQENLQGELPAGKIKTKIIPVFSSTFILKKGSSQFFLEKRVEEGRMQNLWQFPLIDHHYEGLTITDLERLFFKKWAVSIKIETELFKIVHHYTKYKITLFVYSARFASKKEELNFKKNEAIALVENNDFIKYPLSGSAAKVLEKI